MLSFISIFLKINCKILVFIAIPENEKEELPIIDDGLRRILAKMKIGIGQIVNKLAIGHRPLDISFDWKTFSASYPFIKKVIKFLDDYKNTPLNEEHHF